MSPRRPMCHGGAVPAPEPPIRTARRLARSAASRLATPAGLAARRALRRRGISVTRGEFTQLGPSGRAYPVDFEPWVVEIVERVAPYTQTTPERVAAVCAATEYVVGADVPGDLVECGVWRGGSTMAAALTLIRLGAADRRLHLFDTFSGMTEPDEVDADYAGRPVGPGWRADRDSGVVDPCAIPQSEVRDALATTGYDPALVSFVEGPVEDTLPDEAPESIALLRLDTDWYASTAHELRHLYPRLGVGGVLIVDDYGHFQGARRATDEYFAGRPILLARVDYTGRMAVKPPDPPGGVSRR